MSKIVVPFEVDLARKTLAERYLGNFITSCLSKFHIRFVGESQTSIESSFVSYAFCNSKTRCLVIIYMAMHYFYWNYLSNKTHIVHTFPPATIKPLSSFPTAGYHERGRFILGSITLSSCEKWSIWLYRHRRIG